MVRASAKLWRLHVLLDLDRKHVYYYEDENENMKKAHGKWLGRAQNHGDYICSCIFT